MFGDPAPRHDVLIVEDDSMARELLAAVLEEEGFTVTEVAEGRAALRRLREHLANVIVLDMAMPVMNGWEFLAAKAQMSKTARIPVVVVSGSPPPRLTPGVVAWMEKPVDFDVLLRALKPWAP